MIESFVDVRARAAQLGCEVPEGLALLPGNFESAEARQDLVHDASGLTVRALWRSQGLEETRLEPGDELWPATQKDAGEWLGPTIFIGTALWSENPEAINVALGVVANYVTDLFRGTPRDQHRATLNIVLESESGETQKLQYSGPPEGIRDLPDVVKEMRG